MIQDIFEKFDLEYKEYKVEDEDYILTFKNNSILLYKDRLPKYKELRIDNLIYLFKIGEKKYFINLNEEIEGTYKTMQEVREHSDIVERFAIITARHLNVWYENNKYCGRCGKLTFFDKLERAKRCTCNNIIYPRINPAVIVGVIYNDQLLLTKYSKGFSKYALIAGFVEIGESLEDTVKREVFEEVGLKVKNIRYYKSQPWGLSETMLAGFYCEVDGIPNIDLSSNELKEATWFKKEDILGFDTSLSLTNTMIMHFKDM